MTDSEIIINETGTQVVRESLWRTAWRTLLRHPAGMIGLIGFTLVLLAVLLAPVLSPIDPTAMDYNNLLEPPSSAHIFGTDDLGRDVLSRVLWGGRESLKVALMALVIAAIGGVLFGLIAGYFGGGVDGVIMRVMDVLLAFPSILLVLSIVAALGPNLITILIAIGLSNIPGVSRFVRGTVLEAKNNEYVLASQVLGASHSYVMFTQILPNILAPLIIYSTVGLGSFIMMTAGLSYIGLGAQPPSPEWGAMLSYGRDFLRDGWWMSVFPGIAIFLSVLFINLLGDGLRDAFDPKLRV